MFDDRSRLRGDARGVSPVLGAAMTMAITVGAIAAIMMWGLPTLQESEAQATLEAVAGEMKLLDDLVDSIAESGGGISGEAVFTFDRGGMRLDRRSDRWVVSYGIQDRADVAISGVADGNATYTLSNLDSSKIQSAVVENAEVLDSRTRRLNTVALGNLSGGGSGSVQVKTSTGTPVPLREILVRVRVYEFGVHPENLVAEAWIFDPGAVRYELSTAGGFYSADLINGALVIQEQGRHRIEGLDALNYFETEQAEQPFMFLTLEELTPQGPGRTAGAGTWTLKAVSESGRSLTPSRVTATDVRIEVTNNTALWQRALWSKVSTVEGGTLTSDFEQVGDRLYLEGPAQLSLFYHRASFPTGFEAS